MKNVIELLKEMGAKNIIYNGPENEWDNEFLTFEYEGKEVGIQAVWCNTESASLEGYVEQIKKDDDK